MQQETFYILTKPDQETPKAYICFNAFIAYLERRVQTETKVRARFYEMALQQFLSYPGIRETMPADELKNHDGLLDILDACLFPQLNDREKTLWALSVPQTDYIFYSTTAFYNLMSPLSPSSMFAQTDDEEKTTFYTSIYEVKYALILDRIYNLQPHVKKEIIYIWTDKKSGLPLYFDIDIDNRFVEVKQNQPLPYVQASDIGERLKHANCLCDLSDLLPLDAFSFEGFTITTATNITAKHALHKMRSAILKHNPQNAGETYRQIIHLLQALCGTTDIRFGMLPFLKLSGELVLFYENYSHSIVINMAREQQLDRELLLARLNDYYANPHIIFHNAREENNILSKQWIHVCKQAGISEYALLPVYQNNELIGLLEMSAAEENILSKELLPRLEPAMPIVAQLMFLNQAEFAAAIDKVVSTNFTAIQPAVRWKFDEAAWKYLETHYEDRSTGMIEPIRFGNVYPLYGTIDIRNSTIEKNGALYRDMQFYFSLLLQTLASLQSSEDNAIYELINETRELQAQTEFMLVNNESAIAGLMKKAHHFLYHFAAVHPEQASVADAYYKAVDADTGMVNTNRRALESSMQIVNNALNKHLDQMQADYQHIYPVYFEKFRTDGVEYDMYIGQSIAPHHLYKNEYLHRLRREQLRSMAAIVKLVHDCVPQMQVPLQTTQLIYVNANAIDISFRMDEKRFDVEGAYNTRYHIVKKRIDKVHIQHTDERLTKPDAIAIVYSQKEHAEEYKAHIAKLQQEGIVGEAEELELEELQGVTGLKALRVSVVSGDDILPVRNSDIT